MSTISLEVLLSYHLEILSGNPGNSFCSHDSIPCFLSLLSSCLLQSLVRRMWWDGLDTGSHCCTLGSWYSACDTELSSWNLASPSSWRFTVSFLCWLSNFLYLFYLLLVFPFLSLIPSFWYSMSCSRFWKKKMHGR